MGGPTAKCVLLADRHHGLSEGISALLRTAFEAVVMVSDEASLMASAARLQPALAVVDLSLERGGGLGWLPRLRDACPDVKVIVISVHDEPAAIRAARAAGADGYVVKHALGTDLLPAAEAVLAGRAYP